MAKIKTADINTVVWYGMAQVSTSCQLGNVSPLNGYQPHMCSGKSGGKSHMVELP